MMCRAAALFLVFSLLAGSAWAFSGNGLSLLQQARVYMLLDPAPDGGPDVASMDKLERLEKVAELLEQAAPQTVNDRERKILDRYLGRAYNELALEHDSRKDYSAAIDAEMKAIEHVGDASPTLRGNLGGMYYDAGDYYAAAQSYERARELDPNPQQRAAIVTRLVGAYIKDAQTRDKNSYQAAIRLIEDELQTTPDDPNLLVQLGFAYQHDGDPARALEAWEKARQLTPFDPAMEEQYKRLKGTLAAKQDFVRDNSRHFLIDFNDKTHTNLAERFLEIFEDAHDDLGRKFAVGGEQEKVTVTVYTDAQFDQAVRLPWAGGVHQANRIDLRVNPSWPEDAYTDTIRHEYTHHLVWLKASGKAVPTWLQEGLAMRQERKLDVKPFYKALGAALKYQKMLPLETLSGSFENLPPALVMVAYAESYDFVRYLMEKSNLNDVSRMLEGLAQGQSEEEAFEAAFRMSLADAESAWRTWLDERAEAARAKSRSRMASQPTTASTTAVRVSTAPTYGGLTASK